MCLLGSCLGRHTSLAALPCSLGQQAKLRIAARWLDLNSFSSCKFHTAVSSAGISPEKEGLTSWQWMGELVNTVGLPFLVDNVNASNAQ